MKKLFKKTTIYVVRCDKNNKFLTDVFNVREVRDLGRFLDVIEKQNQK